MWETLRNAWRAEDLRKRIIYTVLMLLLYRLLCYVPTPGVNLQAIRDSMQNLGIFDLINTMTGSNLDSFTIMAMGIQPYINSSIIMQLLTVAIPKLEEMNKEGEEGRKKIAQYTRYVTIALGFIQAVFYARALGAATGGFMNYFTIGVTLAGGTALAMWISERITEKGVGNGMSLLIFAGIIARIGPAIVTTVRGVVSGEYAFVAALCVLIISLALIVAVTFVDRGERRIPVQYAKRMVGRRMYGGQSTHIPMKVNSSGVLPLIFANAIIVFPQTILTFFGQGNPALVWWNDHFSSNSPWFMLLFFLMIVGFTFFYNTISFNPVEMSKNIQQNGGMIPGIRQGKPTSDFLARISKRITLFGALFLGFLALLPSIVTSLAGMHLLFQASSLLIAVSVALETTKQIESLMMQRNYKGFLR